MSSHVSTYICWSKTLKSCLPIRMYVFDQFSVSIHMCATFSSTHTTTCVEHNFQFTFQKEMTAAVFCSLTNKPQRKSSIGKRLLICGSKTFAARIWIPFRAPVTGRKIWKQISRKGFPAVTTVTPKISVGTKFAPLLEFGCEDSELFYCFC